MALRVLCNLIQKRPVVLHIRNESTTATTTSTLEIPKNDEPIDMVNPFQKEKTKCILCRLNMDPNYKNVKLLSQFQSPYTGRIYGRHITGLCKGRQEQVEKEITKAQSFGLMPTYHKSVEFLKDPRLFDPERPIRSHKY